MSKGPDISDIPEVEGGTPRDTADKVIGQNRQAAFIYKAKHEGLILCISSYNNRE